MAAPFAETILSDIFTFYVGIGEKKDAVQTYSKAIAATSDKMKALVEGNMNEAETRCANLEDVQTEDFIRYYEFAMRGDYTPPSWELDETVSEDSETWPPSNSDLKLENPPERIRSDIGVPRKLNLAKPKTRPSIHTELNNRNYFTVEEQNQRVLSSFIPSSNSEANQNFKPVFLAHARLYTFADMQLAYTLKKLVLSKLRQTLMDFKLFNARIGDIIELARYAYEHNMDRKEDGAVDGLRKLVVDYIAYQIEIFGKSNEFEEFLGEGGEFVVDFWRVAREYLIAL